jgi:Fic family protein
MQVVSGAMGREKVHFQAPDSHFVEKEMNQFLDWFNTNNPKVDLVIKAAVAHLWFVTVHPFDDGNGRIARALTDMLLAQADKSNQRFYSMSAQIRVERKEYYEMLEKTQKGEDLDITDWILWFLNCLINSLKSTDILLARIIRKAQFWTTHTNVIVNERQKKLLNKMLDGFDGKLTSSKWAKIAKCSKDSAIRDINDLIEKELLQKEAAGGRSTNYELRFN